MSFNRWLDELTGKYLTRKRFFPLRRRRRPFRLGVELLESRILLNSSNPAFLGQTYRDLLEREADQPGLTAYNGLLAGGASRFQVVRAIESSPEYRVDEVENHYQALLGRAADPGGLSAFATALGGVATPEQVTAAFLSSREYFQRAGANNSSFLVSVYHDILGRPPEAKGAAAWHQLFAAVSFLPPDTQRLLVATGIVSSVEAHAHRVNGLYQHFLHRQVDPVGLQAYLGLEQHGLRDEDFIAAIIISPEYDNLLQNPTRPGPVDTQPPTIAILSPASGSSTSHNVTVTGQVTDDQPGVSSLQAAVDSSSFGNVSVAASGNFSFTTALVLDGTADGSHTIHFQATDKAGNMSGPTNVTFNLDTRPPSIAIQSPTAGLTTNKNVTVTGQVTDALSGVAALEQALDNGSFSTVTLDSSGNFAFTTSLLLDGTANGNHTIHLQATDKAGNRTPTVDISFTLDAKTLAAPAFDLSRTSSVVGLHRTSSSRVLLVGQTDRNVTVTLMPGGAKALSSDTGLFQFPDVALALGDNPLTTHAVDALGNSSDFSLTVQRVQAAASSDVVLDWNHTLLEAIRLDDSAPPLAARNMAIVQGAVYDAINAIQGTPSYFVHFTAPADASPVAAVATAADRALTYLYPAQTAVFDAALATSLAQVTDGQAKTDGVSLGRAVADAILALRRNDGYQKFVDYVPGTGAGVWQPTPPMFAEALLPQWATLQPFAMTSPDQFRPAGPPALTSQAWADAFNEVKNLGSGTSATRTADQTQIARFWADGGGSYTPPGHWNQIAAQIAQQQGNSLAANARLFAALDIAMADAAIVAWDAKYHYNSWRPITAIRAADTAGNAQVQTDPHWTPLLVTPNFPEYVSGHSTFSAAAAAVLASFFGTSIAFSTTSATLPGVTRSFTSFDQAAGEAGQSRIYAGIHFQFANQDGQAAGRALAGYVLSRFTVAEDKIPPKITFDNVLPSGASNKNVTVGGQVTDNLSGVASLQMQIDQGNPQNVAFDAIGKFTVPTTFALDGSADGSHILHFVATDAVGNVSAPSDFAITLDTKAPAITLTSPTDGSSPSGSATLAGSVDGTGSALTAFAYTLDGGTSMPIAFPAAGGAFSQSLDLSRLATGSHTLVIKAMDAAGNTVSKSVAFTLTAPAPFRVASITPASGASDVGLTFRPKAVFSRPVNAATLTSDNFFAKDTAGAKLPATIVPGNDGSFAWLFFTNPMPGASTITLTVDGSTIRASNGDLLDAADTGTAGSKLTSRFTTVSQAAVPGTALTGILADPGPDLQPGTFDDVRPGPDGLLNDADDIYLHPIAGVKVFILGHEDPAVITDANGRFTLSPVPVGDVKLALEGTTATNAPSGFYFPDMVMDLTIQPDITNTVMGSMGPREQAAALANVQGVYLPRLQSSLLKTANASAVTHIGVDAVSAPNITPEQRKLLSMDVPPNSLVGPDGKQMSSAQIGISTVPPMLVRDMLPAGLLQHTFDITVQAPGVATFSTPAPLTFPNIFQAAPGTQMNFLSFDHTTGRLVIEGTATVSADGQSVTTDPGTGITHPGWHGLTPPGGPSDPPCPPASHTQTVTPDPVASGLQDYFFKDDNGSFALSFGNAAKQIDPNRDPCDSVNAVAAPLDVDLKVDGSPDEFLTGLPNHYQFQLEPGQQQTLQIKVKPLLGPGVINMFDKDRLYGAKIEIHGHVDGEQTELFGTTGRVIYVYRFLDIADDNHTGGRMEFIKTLATPDRGIAQERELEYHGPAAAKPTAMAVVGGTEFGVSGDMVRFNPAHAGDHNDSLSLVAPDGTPFVIGLDGRGLPPQRFLFPKSDFIQAVKVLVDQKPPIAAASDFVDQFPDTDSDGSRTTGADAAAFLAKVDQLYDDIRIKLTSNLPAYGVDVVDSSTGPGIQIHFHNAMIEPMGNMCGPSGTPACAHWADFNKTRFKTVLVPESAAHKTSPAEDKFRFASIVNRSPSDNPGGAEAVKMNLDVLAAAVQGTPDELPTLLANAITHEVGHDLGAIHLRDFADNYIFGNGDVMGSAGTASRALHTFITFQPLVRFALGLPVPDTDFQAIWDYYATFERFEKYDHNEPLPSPGDSAADLTLPGPLLRVFDAPLVVGGSPVNFVKSVNFGSKVADGNAAAKTLYVFNDGYAGLHITSIRLVGGNAGFVIQGVDTLPLLLPAGDANTPQPAQSTQVIRVKFNPAVGGAASDILRIESDSIDTNVLDIPLSGEGIWQGGAISAVVPNNNLGGVQQGGSGHIADQFATIRNIGAQALTITNIKPVGSAFMVGGLPSGFGPTQPLVLDPGQSHDLNVTFNPTSTGLERGDIQIFSSDPNTPVYHLHVVGTGLPATGSSLHYGKDFVAIETPDIPNAPVLRQISDDNGNWQFFLPPNARYHYAIFDPISGLIAQGLGVSAASGQDTRMPEPVFQASTTQDTDGDGLPDDVEFAVGTDPHKVFTAGDGIDDFTHVIIDHTDPLGGRGVPTGIIATLSLKGDVQQVVVEGSATDAQRLTGYAATDGGLAILDVSQFDKPVVLSQIPLSARATGVAVDPMLQIAAVATESGLQLVDVSEPLAPKLLQAVNLVETRFPQVQVQGGAAYVTAGTPTNRATLVAIDMGTGETLQTLTLGGDNSAPLQLARDGTMLYTLDATGLLRVIDISGTQMVVRGSVQTGIPSNVFPSCVGPCHLFAGNGIAYVPGADQDVNFYVTVDVADPDHPSLIHTQKAPPVLAPKSAIALNGSGLGLALGAAGTVVYLDVLNMTDPANRDNFLTRFVLTDSLGNSDSMNHGLPGHVTIAAGIAFVADSNRGLEVVNYLPFDTKGIPPTVTISTPASQVVEGTTIPINADVHDDVQVRNVELLVNGHVVHNAVSFPFNLSTVVPIITPQTHTLTIQARATDTGGNTTLSNTLTLEILHDPVSPKIVSIDPADGTTVPADHQTVQIIFSKPMDVATVTSANFQILDSDGKPIAVSKIQLLSGKLVKQTGSIARLSFAALAAGTYRLVTNAAAVKDLAGNALGADNVVSRFTVDPYSIRWVGTPPDAMGQIHYLWNDPQSWDQKRLPGPGDRVLIDVRPSDPLIKNGGYITWVRGQAAAQLGLTTQTETTITSLTSNVSIILSDIIFTVTGTLSEEKTLAFAASVLRGATVMFGPHTTMGEFGSGVGDLYPPAPSASAVLDGVTLVGDLDLMREPTGLIEQVLWPDGFKPNTQGGRFGFTVVNGLTVNGSVEGDVFDFLGSQTLAGSATFTNTALRFPHIDTTPVPAPGTLTIGPGITFREGAPLLPGPAGGLPGDLQLQADIAVSDGSTIINLGKIIADGPNPNDILRIDLLDNSEEPVTSRFSGATFINQGVVRAQNNGHLIIDDFVIGDPKASKRTFINSNILGAASGGTLEVLRGLGWSTPLISADKDATVLLGGNLMIDQGRTTELSGPGTWILGGNGFGSTVSGGTLTLTHGARLNVAGIGTTFNGVNVNGDVQVLGDLRDPQSIVGSLTVTGGLTLNGTLTVGDAGGTRIGLVGFDGGTQTLGGNALIEFGANAQNALGTSIQSGTTLTLAPTVSVHGGHVHLKSSVTNQGTIVVDKGTLTFDGGWSNTGQITATDSIVNLGGGGSNAAGKITVTNSIVNLGGLSGLAGLGSFIHTGSTINLTGVLDNTNSTLVLDAGTGSWYLRGGTVKGGTLTERDGSALIATAAGGTLNGLTVNGDLDVTGEPGANVTIRYVGMTLNGTLRLGNAGGSTNGILYVSGVLDTSRTIDGTGTIVFGASPQNVIGLYEGQLFLNPAALTIGPNVTIRGQNGTILGGNGFASGVDSSLFIQGTITADTAGGTIAVKVASVTNAGTLQAINGGTILFGNAPNSLSPTGVFRNTGRMTVGPGSAFTINSDYTQTVAGSLVVQIAAPNGQFGQVNASGKATLDGTLNLTLVNGYVPRLGDTFKIMIFASRSGQFRTVNGLDLGGGLRFRLDYNATDLTLTVTNN